MHLVQLLHKNISFTSDWQKTTWIGLILGSLIAFMLIFLQPLDTYQSDISYKNLKLSGYALMVLIPVLLLHFFELIIYKKLKKKWLIKFEILVMVLGILLMNTSAYLYNVWVINQFWPNWEGWGRFLYEISLPYIVIILPLWGYLRRYWGEVFQQNMLQTDDKLVVLRGKNKDEVFEMYPSNFIYAQAQQNYVEIYFLNEQKEIQKITLRLTLSELQKQLSQARQIHRSFLVNLDYQESLQGNARKRNLKLKYVDNVLPVSQKYYPALAKFLTNSSQKAQNNP